MHNDYVRPNGLWPVEFVLTPGDLRRFDVAQTGALDGDAGGSWVPLTQIILGGVGLVLTGGSSLGHKLTGGVLTFSGGRVYLGASIYPSFLTPVTRTLSMTLSSPSFDSTLPTGAVFQIAGVQALSFPVPSRSLHNGGTLTTIAIAMQVGLAHQLTPARLPNAVLLRDDYVEWVRQIQQWAPSTSYSVGVLVQPTLTFSPTGWPLAYVSTGGSIGTSGSSEPNWNAAGNINNSITDGSVTWVACGYTANPVAWAAASLESVGNVVKSTPDNGMLYVVTAIAGTGRTGASQPAFGPQGTTVIDNPGANQVTWTCLGRPRAASWTPSTVYKENVFVTATPDNGFYYYSKEPGTSSSSPPTWGTVIGANTLDGGGSFAWVCVGTNPVGSGSMPLPSTPGGYDGAGQTQALTMGCTGGAAVVDTANHAFCLIIYDESGLGAYQSAAPAPWTASVPYLIFTNSVPIVTPVPPNGFYYTDVAGGTSASSPPTWPTVLAATVTEIGGPEWQCTGVAVPSQNVFLTAAFTFTSIADMRPE